MPGLGQLSGAATAAAAAAAVVFLRFQSIVVLHAPSVAADSTSERHHPETRTNQVAFRKRPPAFDRVICKALVCLISHSQTDGCVNETGALICKIGARVARPRGSLLEERSIYRTYY